MADVWEMSRATHSGYARKAKGQEDEEGQKGARKIERGRKEDERKREREIRVRVYATCERVCVERGNAFTARNRICRGPSFHPV